jgi:hypothetical protein
MIDYNEIQNQYLKAYTDKTRIYFIEQYLSTFNADERKTVPFILFPRQKALCTNLSKSNKVIAIKHRQAGITTVTSAWITPQLVFAKEGSPEIVLCIGNKLDLACQLLDKIRQFLLQVPRWYWGDDFYSTDPKSKKNSKDIFLKNAKDELQLFNGCEVHARSSGPNAARGISSVTILVFDEAAFIENGKDVYAAAVAATSTVSNAKIVMISTPNGKDQLYYETYRQAQAHSNGYVVAEFKWYQDPRYNRNLRWYKKNKKGEYKWIIETVLDTHGNIKYDEDKWKKLEQEGWKPISPWYEMMCKSLNNDSMRIAQELEVSFLGSSDNVIDPVSIDKQRTENIREPLPDFGDPHEEGAWFWKRPIEGHRYVLACDPSVGSSADRTAIQILDADGKDDNGFPIMEQIMEYSGRKLGDAIGDLLYRYGTLYNNAFIVVDSTGSQGDAALLRLMHFYHYKNLYYDDKVVKDYMKVTSKAFAEEYADRMPGFHFQGNRFALLTNFANAVRENEFKIRSSRLVNELDTWVFKGDDGRMDHMEGMHDDLITCIAMGLFVMQFSFKKLEATKSKDAAILNSYMLSGGYKAKTNELKEGKPITPGAGLPFYNNNSFKNNNNNGQGSFMWLISGYM